jgi:hypothetical protein
MRKIDVQISKAFISGFTVEFGDDKMDVIATVDLFTQNEKKVSCFTISTRSWCTPKFDLPMEMVFPIRQIASQLEAIVVRECGKSLCLIGGGGIEPRPEMQDTTISNENEAEQITGEKI